MFPIQLRHTSKLVNNKKYEFFVHNSGTLLTVGFLSFLCNINPRKEDKLILYSLNSNHTIKRGKTRSIEAFSRPYKSWLIHQKTIQFHVNLQWVWYNDTDTGLTISYQNVLSDLQWYHLTLKKIAQKFFHFT